MYKRPYDILDYTLDWYKWLTPANDTIQSVEYIIPAGSELTKVTESSTETTTRVWLSGGKKGKWTILCHIMTVGGRRKEQLVPLEVLS